MEARLIAPYLLLLLALGGCIQNTDVLSPDKLPIDRVSKPYVLCFISPQDTLLTAKVAMSEPRIVSDFSESLLVRDAVVTLSDSLQSIQLRFDDARHDYRADPRGRFVVRAGGTYRLTVQMTENQRVSATATVPAAVPIRDIAFDSTATSNSAGVQLTTYTTAIRWLSPAQPTSPGGLNYYRGWGEVTQVIVNTTTGRVIEQRISQPSFSVDREVSQPGVLRLMTGTHTNQNQPNTQVRTKRVRVGLFTTDVNYYRYHASLREQLVGGGPSFAESSVLFSNIEGGYGVFGTFNADYRTLPGLGK